MRTPDGRRVSKSFTRKMDAEQWSATQRTDMIRGDWVDPKAGTILLTEWLAQVEQGKLNISDTWRKTRRSLISNHIDGTLGIWPIGRITPEALQSWVAGLAETLAPETVRKLHAIVGEALNLAVARGKIVRSPDIEVELPKRETPTHRYLTETEVHALADVIDTRYRVFVFLGAYGGLRPGEAYAAEWGDVDGLTMRIRGTKTNKSRRTVRIPQLLTDELRAHRQAWPHIRLILHNQAGNPVDPRRFRSRQFARAVAASVGEPMRPYDLRHTHVGLLIAQGAHAKAIADRLGHTSIRTTMDTYGHLLEGVESDVVDRLGGAGVPQMAPKTQNGPLSD